jgi:hypothetical protein
MPSLDPKRYREAEVAFEDLEPGAQSYRGFLSRRPIVGPVRRLLGGREWDFRNPYLPRDEVERFRRRLQELGVDARWEGDVLIVTDPQDRWRRASIEPNQEGLYRVGAFGRPARPGSGFLRQWEEVTPLALEPLDAGTIARALDTGLSLGPNFDRIERDADLPALIDALSLSQTDYAQERLCILLAHHRRPAEAVTALPHLLGFLDTEDLRLRRSAASAIATISGRAGRQRALLAAPDLAPALRERIEREDDHTIEEDLRVALGALGKSGPGARDEDAEWFIRTVHDMFGFLRSDYGFEEPTVEDRTFSTETTYRNDTTAVVADADWRDGLVEVHLVKLEGHSLPLYLDTELTHWLEPWLLLHGEEAEEPMVGPSDPRDREGTRRFLEHEAEGLGKCADVLNGDFRRFDRAIAHLRKGG